MYLQISSVSGRWCVRLGLAWAIVGSAVAFGSTALAQVVPDNTVGSAVSGVGSEQTITGGTRQGGNLFHSFDRFSVPTNGAAIFNNALDIQNILSRVTGGSISNIDGLIRANGAANLFLLNPNGIIFGQNARLDVGGSFIATTASSINFADGTQFSATPGTGTPLLTVSVPLGLQFGAGAGEIVNRSQVTDSKIGLQVQPGKTLGLIGANVDLLDGSWLNAAGGRIELGAVATPGVIGISPDNSGFRFNFPTDLALADISLTNSSVANVRSRNGGSIAVNARNLSLRGGSQLNAGIYRNQGSVDAVAGDIDINAQGAITIDGVARFPEGVLNSGILNNVEPGSIGKGGNIKINTGSLRLSNGAVITANTQGQGDAGSIQITATNPNDSVVFESGSFIQTDSFSQSSAGNVTITADGRVSFVDSGISSRAVTREGLGKGGSIAIKARSLSLDEGSQINTITYGQSKGGDITLTAGSFFLSKDSAVTANTLSQGDAGNIQITATNPDDSLVASGGAYIQSESFGSGRAGDITISADGRVSFTGVGTNNVSSGVFSGLRTPEQQSPEVQGDRKGGDINIRARSLSLTEGAQINTSTSVQGDAGNITITADESVSLDNNGRILSQVESTGIGKGGNITIQARSLSLNNGAKLITSTSGQGSAGNIDLQVQDYVFLDNSNLFSNAGNDSTDNQQATTPVIGNVGNIRIKAKTVTLANGSQIQASFLPNARQQGSPGIVSVEATDSISFTGRNSDKKRSAIFTDVESGAVAKGSDIQISAPVVSFNDAFLDASSAGGGDAGSITIQARSLDLINNSFLATSTSGQGNAGNIKIAATDPIDSIAIKGGSSIETSSSGTGNAGNVTISADGKVSLDTNSFITSTMNETAFDSTEQIPQVPTSDRQGGDITIKARSLSLTNGASVDASSLGKGNAGNITIDTKELIEIDGYGSGVFNNVEPEGEGQGGNIKIATDSLSLTNGGIVTASNIGRQGDAGNVTIDARDVISINGQETNGRFAGVYSILTQTPGAEGRGGDINIKARSLFLRNNGQLNTSSDGQGNAGNIIVNVRTLDLDRGGIFAESTSGNGGDIQLRASKSVRLRSGSQISTSAGGIEQGGNGGNITINSPLVIANANGNNDITANAFRGSGGRIEINAQSIIRLIQRSRQDLLSLIGTDTPTEPNFLTGSATNDVAAISLSDPSFSGTISFNTADIDPSRDIVELPTGLVDASSLVAAGCPSGAENRFTVAGRGGLPPAPADKLSPDALLTDWATLQTPETENRAAVESTTPAVINTTPTPPVETITEATSWQYERNGAIILTSGDTTSSSHLKTTPTSCPSS